MGGAEVAGVGEFRVFEAVLQAAVAVRAEGLGRGLHGTSAFMFAMAIDAGALGGLAEGGGDSRQELAADAGFRARRRDAGGGGVVVDGLVAGLAG